MTTLFRAAAMTTWAALLSTSTIPIVGCVKDDPILTGNRDAAAGDDASAAGGDAPRPIVPSPDGPDGSDDDRPDCRHCNETLSTDTSRGTLCRKNAQPSSVERLNALVDCVCYDRCVKECATYCAGSTQDATCSACLFAQCIEPVNACLADAPGGG